MTRWWLAVTGANRGIGFGLVEKYAQRTDTIIYAGARDPSKATALLELAKSNPNIKPVKVISTDLESNKAVAEQIKKEQGGVDVVIANAGIGSEFGPSASISLDAMREAFEVNTLGPLMLFQQVKQILRGEEPKFFTSSTILASLATKFGMPDVAYGTSKTAVNACAPALSSLMLLMVLMAALHLQRAQAHPRGEPRHHRGCTSSRVSTYVRG